MMQTRALRTAFLTRQQFKTNFDKYENHVSIVSRDNLVYSNNNALEKSTKARDTLLKLQKKSGP